MAHNEEETLPAHMNRLTLALPRETEARFQAWLMEANLRAIRFALSVSLALYAGFSTLDFYLLASPADEQVVLLRLCTGIPALLLSLLATFSKRGRELYQYIAGATALTTGISIVGMIMLAHPPADTTYYAGLMLVLFATCAFLRLRFVHAAWVSLTIAAIYLAAATYVQNIPAHLLANNTTFLVSTILIGLTASFSLEAHAKRTFLTHLQLLDERDKTLNMNKRLEREIALREKNARKLIDSEQAMKAIFNAVDVALMLHDTEGIVVEANDKALEFYGLSRENMIGTRRGGAIFPAEEDRKHDQARVVRERVLAGETLRFHWKTGRPGTGDEFDSEVFLRRVDLPDGPKILSAVHDITEQKKAERLQRDLERISRHDLKGPLNVIVSLPSILREELAPLDPEHEMLLGRIEDAGYRMLGMINVSLDMYRMEQGSYELTPTPVDIAAVARRAMQETSTGMEHSGVEFSISVECRELESGEEQQTDPTIYGEELLLHSMISNLVRNAAEEAQRHVPEAFVRLSIDMESDMVRITVSNTGTVAPELRPMFFEKLVTRGKPGGTGLGTYSARLICRLHGGLMRLDAQRENEVRVTALLPRFPESQEQG